MLCTLTFVHIESKEDLCAAMAREAGARSAPSSAPAPSAACASSSADVPPGASWGSVAAGVALVGAAAGYALLGLRFRNMNMSNSGAGGHRLAAGSAEMRAATAVTRQWEVASETASRYADPAAWAAYREQLKREAEQRAEEAARRARAGRSAGRSEASVAGGGALQEAMSVLRLEGDPAHLTAKQAKAAYHARAKECHPDVRHGEREAERAAREAFQALGNAYSTVLKHARA